MSDEPGTSGGATAGASLPASIAIFQYDHVAFKLKDTKIICLPLAFSMQSTSDLWKTSMMRKNDQDAEDLPLTSICLVKDSAGGHTLVCPHGLTNLEIFVDNLRLTEESVASGCLLRGGELVKLFCFTLNITATMEERIHVGPVVLQYHQEIPPDHLPATEPVPTGQIKLDNLPLEILRLIFAYLPIKEAVYTIPATCKKFFEVAREGIPFSQWEITNGSLTMQEAAFCQGWATKPVSHLILTKVPMVKPDDSVRVNKFLFTGMEPSHASISSFEANLEFGIYHVARGRQTLHQRMCCETLADRLVGCPLLKKMKLQGFPTQMLTSMSRGWYNPLVSLEHLWLGCKGNGLPMPIPQEERAPRLPKLKRITLKFSLEGNVPSVVDKEQIMSVEPPFVRFPSDPGQANLWSSVPMAGLSSLPSTSNRPPFIVPPAEMPCGVDLQMKMDRATALLAQMRQSSAGGAASMASREPFTWPPDPKQPPSQPIWNLEELLSLFAPATNANIDRFLILESTGDSWKLCQDMLSRVKRLEGLSLTIDVHLTDEEMWGLVKEIPKSVKFLKVMTRMSFTDNWCLVVATRCTNLEMFCCYGPMLTTRGARPFWIGCERLTKLFLLHDENGVRVAREDILPDNLRRGVRVYERELSCIFD